MFALIPSEKNTIKQISNKKIRTKMLKYCNKLHYEYSVVLRL